MRRSLEIRGFFLLGATSLLVVAMLGCGSTDHHLCYLCEGVASFDENTRIIRLPLDFEGSKTVPQACLDHLDARCPAILPCEYKAPALVPGKNAAAEVPVVSGRPNSDEFWKSLSKLRTGTDENGRTYFLLVYSLETDVPYHSCQVMYFLWSFIFLTFDIPSILTERSAIVKYRTLAFLLIDSSSLDVAVEELFFSCSDRFGPEAMRDCVESFITRLHCMGCCP